MKDYMPVPSSPLLLLLLLLLRTAAFRLKAINQVTFICKCKVTFN